MMSLVNCYGLMIAQKNFISLFTTTFQLFLTTELLVTHSAEFPAQMSAFPGLQFTEPEGAVWGLGDRCPSLQSTPSTCCLEQASPCSPDWPPTQANPPSAGLRALRSHFSVVYNLPGPKDGDVG